mmetsp:Transcript_25362/g.68925  ORF Transcript_25362/g.68925 Transcript_25362/m.68925 type:complete len:297 (-) Transcript_25362:559-1449(-)
MLKVIPITMFPRSIANLPAPPTAQMTSNHLATHISRFPSSFNVINNAMQRMNRTASTSRASTSTSSPQALPPQPLTSVQKISSAEPVTPTATRTAPCVDDEEDSMSLLKRLSQQARDSPRSAPRSGSRIYKASRAQIHMMGTSSWIPTFKPDGTEDGLDGQYLSSVPELEAYEFPSYAQLQAVLLHNGRFNTECKRYRRTEHEPVPMNWAYTINQLDPQAEISFTTPRAAAMSKWLTLVGDNSLRLNTAAKLVVVYEVHKEVDNLLDFTEEQAQAVLKDMDKKRKRGADGEASTSA